VNGHVDEVAVRVAAAVHRSARSQAAAEETAPQPSASRPSSVWTPPAHRPKLSPAGRVRCGSALVVTSVAPVSTLAAFGCGVILEERVPRVWGPLVRRRGRTPL